MRLHGSQEVAQKSTRVTRPERGNSAMRPSRPGSRRTATAGPQGDCKVEEEQERAQRARTGAAREKRIGRGQR